MKKAQETYPLFASSIKPCTAYSIGIGPGQGQGQSAQARRRRASERRGHLTAPRGRSRREVFTHLGGLRLRWQRIRSPVRSAPPVPLAAHSAPRTPDPTLHLALLFPHAGALTSPDDEHVPYFTNTTRRAPEVVIRTAHEMARCKKQLELTKRTGDLHNAQDDRRRSHTRVTSGADNHMLMLPHQPKEDSHLPPAKKVPAYPCPHIRILEQHGKRLRRRLCRRLSTARSAHNQLCVQSSAACPSRPGNRPSRTVRPRSCG